MADVERRLDSSQKGLTQTGTPDTICQGVAKLTVSKNSFATNSPNYSNLANRRQTFNRLPVWEVSKSGFNPSILAEAGLYCEYDADIQQDVYRCFRCSLKQSSWNFNKDPFIEHKNVSPNCPHINEELAKRKRQGFSNTEDSSDKDHTDNNPSQNNAKISEKSKSAVTAVGTKLESDGLNSLPAISNAQRLARSSNDPERADLRRSIRRLKNSCQKCRNGSIEILFLPCRHLVACEECSDRMKHCICQEEILGTARVYFG